LEYKVWRRRRGGYSGALAFSSMAKGKGMSDNEVDQNGDGVVGIAHK
jgi:hypothetical protein